MKYEHLVELERLHMEEVRTVAQRAFLVDEVYDLLHDAYANVKGGLHFQDPDDLLRSTTLWKVIYFNATIVGVVVYKAKRGLKMVALGIATMDSTISQYTKSMLSYLFRVTFQNTWMEVSEGAERFIIKNGGTRYFVSNSLAQRLTGKEIVSLSEDGYHYQRRINGVLKTKVIVGTPRF